MPRRIQWLIPNAISPPRDGTDRKGQACTVFDLVVHPVAVQFALETKPFRVRLLCHAAVVYEQGGSTSASVLAEWGPEAGTNMNDKQVSDTSPAATVAMAEYLIGTGN